MVLGKIFSPLRNAGPVFLRLAVGAVFLFHGAHKVGLLGEQGFTEAIAGAKGAAVMVGMPEVFGYVLAFTELVGGLCLVLGLFTRYFAVALGFAMVMAAWKVHGPNGFDIREQGFEYNAVLIACCLCLLVQGGGWLSLDRILGGREN